MPPALASLTSPIWPLATDPAVWTPRGAGLVLVTSSGVEYEVSITSTATVVVQPESAALFRPYTTFLRMYGLNDGLVGSEPGGKAVQLEGAGNPTLPNLPQPYFDTAKTAYAANIAYWDSNEVSGDGSLATAADFEFRASVSLITRTVDGVDRDFASGVLVATAIPGVVDVRTLDGVPNQFSAYKDVHVLKLGPDTSGQPRGWLMTAARYHSDAVLGVGYPSIGPDNTRAAIVGFWSPDPGFATEVHGPFFLVGRWHDLDLNGTVKRVPLWLGVPCAVEVETEGESWLYVYYTAEDSDIDHDGPDDPDRLQRVANWQPGTFVRRIRTADLPWNSPTFGTPNRLRVGDGSGGTVVTDMVTAANELAWDSASELMLVAGEALGKVNIWASRWPAGGLGMVIANRWFAGDDPSLLGNRLVWDIQTKIKDVDGVAVAHADGLVLYVALNMWQPAEDAPFDFYGHVGWGLWRTAAGPATAGRAYGTDFVLRWIDESDSGGELDCVARSNPSDSSGTPWDDNSQMRLDPDPVRVPSGEWIVFTGSEDTRPDAQVRFALERFDTTEWNGDRRFPTAWRL